MHPSSNSGLMSFILAFGKKDTKKEKMSNIVTGFATAMGESKSKFQQGISHYLLMHLGKAVFEGKNAIVKSNVFGKALVGFEYKTMGLNSRPAYFNKLAVSHGYFLSLAQKVRDESKDANAQAAAAWLASGGKAKYKSFEDKAQANVDTKTNQYKEDVYMNSLKAIQQAWKTDHTLSSMPLAGSIAGASVPAVRTPNQEQVKKAAQKAAEKWVKDNQQGASSSATKAAEQTAVSNAQKAAEKKKEEEKKGK